MPEFSEVKKQLIQIMCEAGELVRKGDDLFEDLGGHIIHESNLDGHIEAFTASLTDVEREELAYLLGVLNE